MNSERTLNPARREAMISFLERHARGKDPRSGLIGKDDEFVELVYHKCRAVIATIPAAEREESLAWLRDHGSAPVTLPVSPTAARSIGLVPTAGHTPDWEEGPPMFKAMGWRDMRGYLPSPMPADWEIVRHRADGALELRIATETVLVLSGSKTGGKQKVLQISIGHERDQPVDVNAVLRRLRNVRRVVEKGTWDGIRLFTAPVRGFVVRGDVEH